MTSQTHWCSDHISWLTNTGVTLKTVDNALVELWRFDHQPDDTVLSAWARHFRNHYCGDDEIDALVDGTPHTKAEYLKETVFPDHRTVLGPIIRSGDFAEILVADYLEYLLGYWVPRTRYDAKTVRDESTKGSDVLGLKFFVEGKESPKDILAIYETKAQLSGRTPEAKLQSAVDDSAKDHLRRGESLNAMKRRFLREKMNFEAERIQRFQNIEDRPYKELYGAAAVIDTRFVCHTTISNTDASSHPNRGSLKILVISGDSLMKLVHELYQRATDEA